MTDLTIAAAAAAFGRDLEFGLLRIAKLIADARAAGAGLLVLPDGALGGYLADLNHPDPETLPPALERTDAVFTHLAGLAAEMVVVLARSRALLLAGVPGPQNLLAASYFVQLRPALPPTPPQHPRPTSLAHPRRPPPPHPHRVPRRTPQPTTMTPPTAQTTAPSHQWSLGRPVAPKLLRTQSSLHRQGRNRKP